MSRTIDPTLAAILKKYDADPKTDIWDCHGKWVAYHSALERIAAKAGVVFDRPMIVESDGNNKSVALCVFGSLDGRMEWSIGEASQHNYRTSGKQAAYPYAMAEKRGKDRVILKLLGIHGLVYSEEEMDEPAPAAKQTNVSLDSQAAANDLIRELQGFLTVKKLQDWGESPAIQEQISRCTPADADRVRAEYKSRLKGLKQAETLAA